MNNKKTILYLVTQSELGGVQNYIYDLSTSLRDEFNVVVGFGEQGKDGELAKKLDILGIENYEIPHLKREICPRNDILAMIEIVKLIRKVKADIVHLNSSKISILGSIAAKLFTNNTKIIYTAHGWVFNEPMSASKKSFYKFAEKFTATFKDKIICVSEYDKNVAIKEKITSEEKLTTVHNGAKEINFLPKEEAKLKILNTKYLILNTDLLIGTIANHYPTKGLEYLIKSAKILKDKDVNFKLLIIGEGSERKKLEDMIKKFDLKNNVILTGRIDEAHKLLKAFDTYVCSSVKEGLPYTIINAMQAGLPIVSTNVGGIPELIEDGKSGLLVEPKNPELFAKKIIEIIKNIELSNTLGEAAKEKSAKEFALESMISKTKETYLKLISQ